MRTCVVKGCKSRDSKGSSVRFHSFPEDPSRRQLWLSVIQLKRELKDGARICGLHFKPDDYDDWCRLRHRAVPSEVRIEVLRSEEYEVCRACLTTNCKMFILQDHLKQAYDDVSGRKVRPNDGLPNVLCWECRARILSAARWQAQSRDAHVILSRLLKRHGSVTPEAVNSVNRREKKLTTHLTCKHIDSNDDYVYINEDPLTDTIDIKPFEDIEIKNEISIESEDCNDIIDDDNDKKDIHTEMQDSTVYNEDGVTKDEKGNKNDKHDDVNEVQLHDKFSDVKITNKGATNVTSVKRPAVKRKRQTVTYADTVVPGIDKNNELKDFTITKVPLEDELAAVERRKESAIYKNAPYKCEVCYRGYKIEWQYQSHVLKHTDKYGTHECSVCKMRYRTEGLLHIHTVKTHSDKYECDKCPFVTNNKSTALKHVTFHSGTKLHCPHCPRQFEKMSTYYSHLRLKHACDAVCEHCGHTFLNKYGVMRHKATVHKFLKDTVLEGPYCTQCDVTFASQEAHDKHLTVSSKHRKDDESPRPIRNVYRPPLTDGKHKRKQIRQPVHCEQCGVTFLTKSLYAGHFRKVHRGQTRTQHPEVKLSIFMCEQCGRKFQSMSLLSDHKWVHTGEKKFKCDTCQKSFTQKVTLACHMKMHSANRPRFECDICGKNFSFYSNKSRHMFIHTGLKPFKCETCGKTFTTSGEQRAHVEHVHLKKPWPKRQRAKITTLNIFDNK